VGNAVQATVTILGSGTSTGVPVIGCSCATCTSSDSRDKRLRSSVLLQTADGQSLVIDTGPDFRMQMLNAGVTHLTEVLYTHTHADHCHGFDDLRAFYFSSRQPVTCHVATPHCADFRARFSYAFEETGYLGTKPQVVLAPFERTPFAIGGLKVDPDFVPHGHTQTAVFRIGRFAYATDFKVFPPELIARWRGKIDTMVASAIRYGQHPTHSCVEETLALFDALAVKRGYLTHIAHEMRHAVDELKLPSHVRLAYDGLEIPVEL
jgi:phosphoribosyl 1,2-cyclic phosphate phosphodiesterase